MYCKVPEKIFIFAKQKNNEMKKTVSISLGNCSFILDEDAMSTLENFFTSYRRELLGEESKASTEEIIEEVEIRMAELFRQKLGTSEVVTDTMAHDVLKEMGFTASEVRTSRKMYRDLDNKVIGGVCAGLSHHLDVDVVVVRLLFALAMVLGMAGFWIYIVFWIIVPAAKTPVERCEMYGDHITSHHLGKNGRR